MNSKQSWTGIQNISWIPVLNENLKFNSQYSIVPTEGYLAWEYNPLRNYRLSEPMYEKDGKYYTDAELSAILSSKEGSNVELWELDGTPKRDLSAYSKQTQEEFNLYTLRESGELVDFVARELSFNLNHPVDIIPQ